MHALPRGAHFMCRRTATTLAASRHTVRWRNSLESPLLNPPLDCPLAGGRARPLTDRDRH